MNSTVKYVLIGGAAVGGVILIAKAMNPQQPSTVQTVTGGVVALGQSLIGLFGNKGKTSTEGTAKTADADAISGGYTARQIAAMLPGFDDSASSDVAWSSIGDAAISDGAGYSRLSGRNMQSAKVTSAAQRVQLGILSGSQFSF